jgi:hypothetical protein
LDKSVQKRKQIEELTRQLEVERRLKMGAENMLRVFETFQNGDPGAKSDIEAQIKGIEKKIDDLTHKLEVAMALVEPTLSKSEAYVTVPQSHLNLLPVMRPATKQARHNPKRGMLIAADDLEAGSVKQKITRASTVMRNRAVNSLKGFFLFKHGDVNECIERHLDNSFETMLDKIADKTEHPQLRLDFFDKILPVLLAKEYMDNVSFEKVVQV